MIKKWLFAVTLALSGALAHADPNPRDAWMFQNIALRAASTTLSSILAQFSGTCNNTTFLRGDGACAPASGGSGGTVTSVGLSMPTGFSVANSPVTGAGTLTVTTALSGVLKGSAGAFTTATSADILGLWTGTCSSTTYLRGDGACATPTAGTGTVTSVGLTSTGGTVTVTGTSPITGSGSFNVDIPASYLASPPAIGGTAAAAGTFAALTANSGLTVNAPSGNSALTTPTSAYTFGNATDNPTFTFQGTGIAAFGGAVTTNNYFQSTNSFPTVRWYASGQSTNLKSWRAAVSNLVWALDTETDALGTGKAALAVTRVTSTTIADVSVGNATDNPTFHALGTGADTLAGSAVLMPGIASSSAATTGTVCWTTSTGNLTVDTTLACLSSTRRIKQNIQPLDIGLKQVMALQPTSYDLKPQFNPKHLGPQVGLVAEDVEKVDPRLIGLDSTGRPEGVRYMQLTAVLVKAIQEQQTEIADLKKQVARLKH